MPPVATPSFAETFRFWAKLGWISFGGPAGQIAVMHRELVVKRRWMDESHFLHALDFCMLLPGPEAQQLATYLGWRLHGAKGGIAAGVLFVLPGALLLFLLAWLHVTAGEVPWIAGIFHGLLPAVVALVVAALGRIARKALTTPALACLALLAFLGLTLWKDSFVVVLLGAIAIGALGGRCWPRQFPSAKSSAGSAEDAGPGVALLPPVPRASVSRTFRVLACTLTLWWLPLLACGLWTGWNDVHFQQGLFFSKTALITFGGAYAVLPYVSGMAVDHFGWLNASQMMVGLGLAETTPGPLIMVLQFVGFLGAWNQPGALPPLLSAAVGSAVTTWATFVPCFLFVFLGGPHIEGLGRRPAIASALAAVTAAVTGVILHLAVWFTVHAVLPAGRFDLFVLVAAVAAWVALERFKVGALPVIASCAAAGVLLRMLG